MSGLRSALVVIIALVLGVSFTVPAEDVPETAYDEPESLPCESTPVVSMAVPATSIPAGLFVGFRTSWFNFRFKNRSGMQFAEATGVLYPICDVLTLLTRSLRC